MTLRAKKKIEITIKISSSERALGNFSASFTLPIRLLINLIVRDTKANEKVVPDKNPFKNIHVVPFSQCYFAFSKEVNLIMSEFYFI